VLRTMNIRFSLSGRTVQDGVTTPGSVHATEPAVPVRCLFRGPYDVLHLHILNALIDEYARDLPGHHAPVFRSGAVRRKDVTLDSLARALREAARLGSAFGQTYADCISVAIIVRLLASARGVAVESSRSSKLAPWRLKRAFDCVEARLDEPVSLAELASCAGLTRVHFAAQFRAAAGLRPHEYLLRRRIERAQELVVRTGMSLVDVARCPLDSRPRRTSPACSNATRDNHRVPGASPGAYRSNSSPCVTPVASSRSNPSGKPGKTPTGWPEGQRSDK
jgi:AraC family transcriptional regulator